MKMKAQTWDSGTFAPHAQGHPVTGEVKSEVTFLWPEADEWKPAREAREITEDIHCHQLSDPRNTNLKEQ
jgi:hypothetical protein